MSKSGNSGTCGNLPAQPKSAERKPEAFPSNPCRPAEVSRELDYYVDGVDEDGNELWMSWENLNRSMRLAAEAQKNPCLRRKYDEEEERDSSMDELSMFVPKYQVAPMSSEPVAAETTKPGGECKNLGPIGTQNMDLFDIPKN